MSELSPQGGGAFREFYVGNLPSMYVQRWKSVATDKPVPVILVHGGAHSGMCWTECPDGRPGWTHRLVELGWNCFVVDWPGTARSAGLVDAGRAEPGAVVDALVALLEQTGPALLIGHSIGAALAAKAMDEVPQLVAGFVAIAPAPPGNISTDRPSAPSDAPIIFDDAHLQTFFCNAERFPQNAFEAYRRSLLPLSPAIFNALANRDGSGSLMLLRNDDLDIPTLVIAGDGDRLVVEDMSRSIAAFLRADYVRVGQEWGFEGFGHMIPIECGSEAVLEKILQWFETRS